MNGILGDTNEVFPFNKPNLSYFRAIELNLSASQFLHCSGCLASQKTNRAPYVDNMKGTLSSLKGSCELSIRYN